jgi:hypothetical protein
VEIIDIKLNFFHVFKNAIYRLIRMLAFERSLSTSVIKIYLIMKLSTTVFYWFIYVSFIDENSGSDFVESNNDEWMMNSEECGRKRLLPISM